MKEKKKEKKEKKGKEAVKKEKEKEKKNEKNEKEAVKNSDACCFEVRSTIESGQGVYATTDIAEGDVIFTIQQNRLLSINNALNSKACHALLSGKH